MRRERRRLPRRSCHEGVTMNDPVRRLTRAEILDLADTIAWDLLQTTREDAFARLERGELRGTLAEPELRMLREMLASVR